VKRIHRTLALGGVLAAGALALVTGLIDDEPAAGPAASPLDTLVIDRAGLPVPDFDRPHEPLPAPADTPVDAVRRYLDAEIAADGGTAYGALATDSRARAGDAAGWAAAAPDRPHVLGYDRLLSPDSGRQSGTATVETTVSLEPRLDEVSGLVPARAVIEFAAVAEDGGWRIDLEASTWTPLLPPDDGAVTAVERWAEARRQCAPAGEYEGSLLDSPVLADQLCGARGPIVAGPPERLTDVSGPVIAALGPESVEWARVVPLSGPVDLHVVAAPLGDDWVIVAVRP
jgi:hypothetical protein